MRTKEGDNAHRTHVTRDVYARVIRFSECRFTRETFVGRNDERGTRLYCVYKRARGPRCIPAGTNRFRCVIFTLRIFRARRSLNTLHDFGVLDRARPLSYVTPVGVRPRASAFDVLNGLGCKSSRNAFLMGTRTRRFFRRTFPERLNLRRAEMTWRGSRS